MGWFNHRPKVDPPPDPPPISDHAQEILKQASAAKKIFERLLTENHFAGNMKKRLRKPGKKKE